MADNGRWFKVWTSILADPDFQGLTREQRGDWVTFGALTKSAGDRGVLVTHGRGVDAVARTLQCEVGDLVARLNALPNVHATCTNRDNGSDVVTLTVRWANWRKYQEDATVAQRVKALRSKRRGEEKIHKDSVTNVRRNVPKDTPGQPEISDGLSAEDWIGGKPGNPEDENRRPFPVDSVIRSTAATIGARTQRSSR